MLEGSLETFQDQAQASVLLGRRVERLRCDCLSKRCIVGASRSAKFLSKPLDESEASTARGVEYRREHTPQLIGRQVTNRASNHECLEKFEGLEDLFATE